MTRTTVTLPDELAVLLRREAKRHGTSVSDIGRRAVSSFVGAAADSRRELPFVALGRSGQRHTGRDAEKVLAAGFGHTRRR